MIRSLQRPLVRSLVRPIIRHIGSARVVTGNAYPGETLTSTEAGQWFANDVEIAGQTGATYVVALADIGKVIRCEDSNGVTITNSPVIAAFITASGATDTAGLSAIELYLRQQNLSAAARVYPLKSAQNAGTGSTVYGLGGLTENNITLVNGPTWGPTGVTFAGESSHLGRITDFIDASTLTVFHRAAESSAAALDRELISQFDTEGNQRSWRIRHDSNPVSLPYKLLRASDGTTSNFESFEEPGSQSSTSERCYVAQWVSSGGRSLWFNKTPQSLVLSGGTAQTSRHNSTADITINSLLVAGTPSNFNSQRVVADLFVIGTLTDAQRETLTDLINAL